MKIALVLFTKNELKNLEAIFSKIPQRATNKIYAVDANSTDGTREFFKKRKVRIYGQDYKGIGGAYQSAFKNIKEDALIFFHPDGNMNPKDIAVFANRLRKGERFIVGSRMTKGAKNEEDSNFFKPRKWFNIGLATITNIFWGRNGNKCTDVVQGFRAIRTDVYKKLKISRPHPIGPEFEQVIRALKLGIRITEFPTVEKPRTHGETTMPSLKTGWGNIEALLKEVFSQP